MLYQQLLLIQIILLLTHKVNDLFNYDHNLIIAYLVLLGYAREIFQLLEEIEIRKTLLDLPEYVQEDDQVSAMLQTILIALAPM